MKKYNISKEFGIYRKFKPPFGKPLFSIAEFALSNDLLVSRSDENIKITKKKLKTKDNDEIKIYIYEPLKVETDKILLYIHGGGFAFKGYGKHYYMCKRYALEGNCKAVYVDYRVAPKHQYPIPVEDCYRVYKWIIENAIDLKIDINKIIVGGDSAGGCLSVDVTRCAIKDNIVKPCLQMLIYPVLDKRMITKSMQEYTDTPMWNSKLNHKMWEYYLGGKEYISPNEIQDVSNMPDTYIETAEYDCLHDEAIEFAEKLKNVGVKVEVYETKQTMHGFDIQKSEIAEAAILNRIKILKEI